MNNFKFFSKVILTLLVAMVVGQRFPKVKQPISDNLIKVLLSESGGSPNNGGRSA